MKEMAKRRNFEALEYKSQKRQAKLTPKQYLVYSYLMSISKWDAQTREAHYYVYKNSFLVKDACTIIGISQPTWRTAIQKLASDEVRYIADEGSYYKIWLKEPYAPLHIELIKYLLPYGKMLSKIHDQGGNIIAIYSLIYLYWKACQTGGAGDTNCTITINQLKAIFKSQRNKETTAVYKMIMGVFMACGLMKIVIKSEDGPYGAYPVYKIEYVSLDLPENLKNEEKEDEADDKAKDILNKIALTIDEINNPLEF